MNVLSPVVDFGNGSGAAAVILFAALAAVFFPFFLHKKHRSSAGHSGQFPVSHLIGTHANRPRVPVPWLVLAGAMVLALVPLSAVRAENITLGSGAITKDSKVYFGNGILWRVLYDGIDNETDASKLAVTNLGNALLISNDNLARIKFNPGEGDGNVWQGSDAQKWCSNFYKNWPDEIEKAAISATETNNEDGYTYKSKYYQTYNYGAVNLDKEHFFFL